MADHGASVSLPSNRWGDDNNKVVQTEMQHARFGQRQCCLLHVSSTSVQFVRSIRAVQQLLDLTDEFFFDSAEALANGDRSSFLGCSFRPHVINEGTAMYIQGVL